MSAARLAVAAAALAASLAHAGGPLGICNNAPLRYSPASVTLNYDGGGTLGARSKAQADAIVNAATALWTNVPTAKIAFARGADLPVDVTAANYNTYFGNYTDGLNPVIYDTDGSIVDALLGAGQKSSVLGFAGSGWYLSPTCRYAEGHAVINGYRSVSDTTMTVVLAHELGHLIGLDHTQLDSAQGLATSAYPLMYPIAYRNSISLADDDAAAVTALYPDTNVAASYGTLNGTFRLADGVTPIKGANMWARENTSGKVYSSVSDYFMQSNGAFQMLLPPGTYTLHAEAVDSQFDQGSSVGPYADTYPSNPASPSYSFLPPLYVSGVAMAPLTLGNGSPIQFQITAGCTASASFRLDGGGSVTGNCGSVSLPSDPPRLANISTRGQVGTGSNVMIAGFIIGGSTPKTVVVRARGPSLTAQGVSGALANPAMQLVRSSDQVTIATNDDWQSATNAAQISSSGFAPSNAFESAVLMTLAPGAYTAIVSGAGGTTGVGLVEVFEVDHPDVPLVNISTRGQVITGNDVMIGGFVIQGSGPQTVVVRARGPSLAALGVPGALQDPVLQLFSGQTQIAVNDNWQQATNAATIQASGLAPGDAREAAIYITLNPGAYTAIVTGSGSTTGVGLVEVFTTR